MEILGVSGWFFVAGGAAVLLFGFPLFIILKMSKYKKEAMRGLHGKFFTTTKRSYYAMCDVSGDYATIAGISRKKLPGYATQKENMRYYIDEYQVTGMLYPIGRPRFMQTLAPTLSWRENQPEPARIYGNERQLDTSSLVFSATDEGVATLLVGVARKLESDLRGMAKFPSPTLVYIGLGLVALLGVINLIMSVTGGE